MSRFIVGRLYKSTQGTQVVTCIGVTCGGLPYFEWPSGSHGGVSERCVNNWKEVPKEVPMSDKTEFKVGDIVRHKDGETFVESHKIEATVTSVEGDRVWLDTYGKYPKWCYNTDLKLVRRANDTFVIGQKYKDIKSKDTTMIVLAQSFADPTRSVLQRVQGRCYRPLPHSCWG
jgi:hypothetical protein